MQPKLGRIWYSCAISNFFPINITEMYNTTTTLSNSAWNTTYVSNQPILLRKVPLMKLNAPQLFHKLPAFLGTQPFTILFTAACYLFLS